MGKTWAEKDAAGQSLAALLWGSNRTPLPTLPPSLSPATHLRSPFASDTRALILGAVVCGLRVTETPARTHTTLFCGPRGSLGWGRWLRQPCSPAVPDPGGFQPVPGIES